MGGRRTAACEHAGVDPQAVILVEGVSDQRAVEALDLAHVPRPLDRVLTHV